jgi:hypothetical protein
MSLPTLVKPVVTNKLIHYIPVYKVYRPFGSSLDKVTIYTNLIYGGTKFPSHKMKYALRNTCLDKNKWSKSKFFLHKYRYDKFVISEQLAISIIHFDNNIDNDNWFTQISMEKYIEKHGSDFSLFEPYVKKFYLPMIKNNDNFIAAWNHESNDSS